MIFIIMSIVKPNSKIVFFFIIMLMWEMIAFSTGAPDYSTYEWIYNDLYTGHLLNAFEPGFTLIMIVCKALHLSYRGFRIVVATLFSLFICNAYMFESRRGYPAIAAMLFLVAPFPWHISGIRFGLANAIYIYAVTCFVDINEKKERNKFLFFIISAILVHYSIILLTIIFFIYRKRQKDILAISLFVAVIGFLVIRYSDLLLLAVGLFTNRDKVLQWLNFSIDAAGHPNLKGFIIEIILLLGNIGFTYIGRKKLYAYLEHNDGNERIKKFADIVFKMNLQSICYIPFLSINDTYMRLLYIIHSINVLLYGIVFAQMLLRGNTWKAEGRFGMLRRGRSASVYALATFMWTAVIAIYQTWPYLGTELSIIRIINQNILF